MQPSWGREVGEGGGEITILFSSGSNCMAGRHPLGAGGRGGVEGVNGVGVGDKGCHQALIILSSPRGRH